MDPKALYLNYYELEIKNYFNFVITINPKLITKSNLNTIPNYHQPLATINLNNMPLVLKLITNSNLYIFTKYPYMIMLNIYD